MALRVVLRRSALRFFFLLLVCGQVVVPSSTSSGSDEICAVVVEVEGVVESRAAGQEVVLLAPGVSVNVGEVLELKPSSWLVLLTADSTIRKFNGPATMTVTADFSQDEGSILSRLGSAITDLLFARQEAPEAVMGTRMMEEWPGDDEMNLPLLIYPAQGSSVAGRPDRFMWRRIEGVPLYRVSVYSWDRLLWQGTTSDAHIQCPVEKCAFTPGERYYWGVEALIGNTSLRSRSAEFKILPKDTDSRLDQEFGKIDSLCSDPDLCALVKVRLLLALNLYSDALQLIDSYWGPAPFKREIYALRAEILGIMGLYEEAFQDYRNASLETRSK